MDILQALQWRYATKKFDPTRKLTTSQVTELLEVARLAPSSFGLAAWKFVVITDPVLRARLREVSWGQPQITDASHLIVFLARDEVTQEIVEEFIALNANVRDTTHEQLKKFADMLHGFRREKDPEWLRSWLDKQVYIPLGMVIEAAALRGIDACPMEGFDAEKFTAILDVEGYHAVALLPVGYRAADDKYAHQKKVRASKDKVVVEK